MSRTAKNVGNKEQLMSIETEQPCEGQFGSTDKMKTADGLCPSLAALEITAPPEIGTQEYPSPANDSSTELAAAWESARGETRGPVENAGNKDCGVARGMPQFYSQHFRG